MTTQEAMQRLADDARAKKLTDFDIVAYDSFSESVEVFEQKVSNTEISRSAALGIRIFREHRPGIAFTEKLSPGALQVCLDDALSHTYLTDAVDFTVADVLDAAPQNFDRLSPDFEKTSFADLAHFARETETALRSSDKQIENVPYTGAARSSSTGYFLNSRGVSYALTHQEFSAYSAAVAALGDQKKMGFYSNSRLHFADLAALDIAGKAAQRTLEQLGAAPVTPGTYTVLFTNRVSGQLISMYQSPYFAEVAIRGQSRLKGRLGEMIASPLLNLSSVALDENLRGSRNRDSEGYPTRNIPVIENGRFTNFLYNLEAAAIDKVTPTGNGTRSVASKAGTGFKNIVVAPGTKTRTELTAAGRILVIDKLEGSAGCSAVSGEFSIGAQGFLWENGRCVQPVDRITLSANYFDMIRNIEAVSGEYNDQYSSVRVPDLMISGIAVAG